MKEREFGVYTDNILLSIINIIGEHDEIVDGRTEYHGRAILVEDDCGTRMWIRVSEGKTGKLIVDFSTVELQERLRRQGVFSEICEMIKHKDYVESSFITNVCTHEMKEFCEKHKFRYDELLNRYIIKE